MVFLVPMIGGGEIPGGFGGGHGGGMVDGYGVNMGGMGGGDIMGMSAAPAAAS